MQQYALPATRNRAHGLPGIISSGAAASGSDGGHLLPSARGETWWAPPVERDVTPGGPRQEESSHSDEIT